MSAFHFIEKYSVGKVFYEHFLIETILIYRKSSLWKFIMSTSKPDLEGMPE